MNLAKHTGIKISQYPTALVDTTNRKNKLQHEHYLMSYADTNFGTTTIYKNYKVPVSSLRNDFKSFIGIENAKGDWKNNIKLWFGEWSDSNKNNSYIYNWEDKENGQDDYIANKFGIVDDGIDRFFIVKNAPIPCEFTLSNADPNVKSTKIVDKKYIDDRFNGIKVINVQGNVLNIRPYSCLYQYNSEVNEIDIIDTLDCGDGRTTKESLMGNFVVFYIMLPIPSAADINFKGKVNGKESNFSWGFGHERLNLFTSAYNRKQNIYLKCQCHYIEDELFVSCTNALNYEPGSSVTDAIVDEIENSPDTTPSSRLFYKHITENYDDIIDSYNGKINDIHVSKSDREAWQNHVDSDVHITDTERTNWNNKVSSISSDEHLTINESDNVVTISVNTISDRITENTDKTLLPTAAAILEHENDNDIHITDDERTDWNNKVKSVSVDGVYLKNNGSDNDVELSINVTNTVTEDESSIPSSKAVVDYVEENKGVHGIEYDSTEKISNKFRFLGKYVNVIDNNGVIELYFGPNDNPPKFSKFTLPSQKEKYVYESDNSEWALPTGCSTNSLYQYTSSISNDCSFVLLGEKDNEEMTLDKEGTIRFGIYKNGNLLEDSIIAILIDGINETHTAQNQYMTVNITDVVKNQAGNVEHEQYTPNTIRYKAEVKVSHLGILSDKQGATYCISAAVNSQLPKESSKSIIKSQEVFVYNVNIPVGAEIESATYENTQTETVSGITYDYKPSIHVKLKNIVNTEIATTENLNRALISLSDSEGCSYTKSIVLTKDDLETQNGEMDNDSAIYKSKESVIKISTNGVAKLNTIVTAKAYGADGTTNQSSEDSQELKSTNYIWTNGGTDSNLTTTFRTDESSRIVGRITDNKLVILNDSYDSNISLIDDENNPNYTTQLLVQGGYLKHPSEDITSTYSDANNIRYYVRKFSFDGKNSNIMIDEFNISVEKLDSWSQNNTTIGENIRIFLAKDETSEVQQLNAIHGKGINGCAVPNSLSSNRWRVQPQGVWKCNEKDTYYLIIEMTKNTTSIGQIKITK